MPQPNDLPAWASDGAYVAPGEDWDGQARRVSTGLAAWAAAGFTPNAPDNAELVNEWLARVQEWVEHFRATQGGGIFGDGSDGLVTVGANTTLARAMFYTSLIVNAGAVLTTAGYPIFATGTVTIDGAGTAIAWDGNAGADGSAGGAGGAALTATVLHGGSAGGNQGAGGGGAGAVGGASANSVATGSGGNGGAANAGAQAGGAGGASTRHPGDTRSLHALLRGAVWSASGGWVALTGGAGGGGGGDAGGGQEGGGGGSGGGTIVIVAPEIVFTSGGVIRARGGAGGNAEPNAGGGGGGQGGRIYLVTREPVSWVVGTDVLVTGGAGGTASGTGSAGSTGAAGTVLHAFG